MLAAALASVSVARVYVTREEALESAFGPGCAYTRETLFLTDAELARARELAGPAVEIRSALVPRWVARRDGRIVGAGYLDTHRVRTLEETVLVAVGAAGEVARVEILAFAEPEDYKPREAWLRQFDRRRLDDELAVKRGIHGITGATLSSAAVTAATRRILAIDRAVREIRAGGGSPP